MKKILIFIMIMMGSSMHANSLPSSLYRIIALARVTELVQHFKTLGGQNIWWVTDLHGTLVNTPSFELIEGETTKEEFDKINELVTRVIGLTSNEKVWASKTAVDLERKALDFYDEEELNNKLIPLDGTQLNALYNGVIYAGGPKGMALVNYLKFTKMRGQPLPGAIVFTDDQEKNTESVIGAVQGAFPTIPMVAFHYVPDGYKGGLNE